MSPSSSVRRPPQNKPNKVKIDLTNEAAELALCNIVAVDSIRPGRFAPRPSSAEETTMSGGSSLRRRRGSSIGRIKGTPMDEAAELRSVNKLSLESIRRSASANSSVNDGGFDVP